MTAIEKIQARKAETEAAHTQATEARKAAEAAESAARSAKNDAWQEASDAEQWLAISKTARKRARGAPELVVAFATDRHYGAYGAAETEWVERGWRKKRSQRIRFGFSVFYTDTPTGTAAQILYRRGREWCDALEAE